MATILTFDVSRCRKASSPVSSGVSGLAQVLIFTGVRREPLSPRTPRHHPPMFCDPVFEAPMFKDPAPDKPRGRKPRRGKAG